MQPRGPRCAHWAVYSPTCVSFADFLPSSRKRVELTRRLSSATLCLCGVNAEMMPSVNLQDPVMCDYLCREDGKALTHTQWLCICCSCNRNKRDGVPLSCCRTVAARISPSGKWHSLVAALLSGD